MNPDAVIGQLSASQEYFNRSTSCLQEKDSNFAPEEGLMTVARQVAHVAQTIDWFMEGAFREEGFNLDFAGLDAKLADVDSLESARAWLAKSYAAAIEKVGECSAEDLQHPLAEGPVMGGLPRMAIFGGIAEHTAHHRGVLAVYSRLRGYKPESPYGM